MSEETLKPGKFGEFYSPQIIYTPVARLIWPALVEPKAFEAGQVKKYSVHLAFDKAKKAELKKFHSQVKEFEAILPKKYKGTKYDIFRDADEEYEGDEGECKYEYMANKLFILAKTAKLPRLVAANGTDNLKPEFFEGGMFVRCTVTPGYGKDGFFYQLKLVQFVYDDGTRVGGGFDDGADLVEDMSEAAESLGFESVDEDDDSEVAPPKKKAAKKKVVIEEEDEDEEEDEEEEEVAPKKKAKAKPAKKKVDEDEDDEDEIPF